MRREGAGGRARLAYGVPLPAVGLAALGCLFLWELLGLGWAPVARDMQMFFVPQRHLLWEALQSGRLPLWTPFYGTGAPLMANFQSGVFYPPHWLFAALPFFAAFNLLVIFHFVLGGVGAFAFGRQAGLRPWGAALAGAVFMLGGYFSSLLNLLNALQAAAWAPLVGYFLLLHTREASLRSFAGLVGAALLGFLAGEPQSFLIGCVVVGAYAAFRLRRRGSRAPSLPILGATLGLAVLAVVGLAMLQILPTAEMLGESSRARGLSYEEATAFSLDPLRLIHLVFPPDYSDPVYSFGIKTQIGTVNPWLFSVYLGVIPLLIGSFAWMDRGRRSESAFWTVSVVVGVLLSLGDQFPLYRWLFDHLPAFSSFRFPEKFYLLTGLGLAMLAGNGLDALLGRRPRRSYLLAAVGLSIAGIAAKVFWLVGREGFHEFASRELAGQNFLAAYDFAWRAWGQNLDIVLALALATAAVIWVYRRGDLRPHWCGALLLLLASADLFLAHRGLNPTVETEFYQRSPMIARYLPMEELRATYRYRATPFDELAGIVRVEPGVAMETQKWLWQQVMAPNVSQYHRILAPDTWDAIHLQRYIDQHEIFRVLPDPDRRWRLLALTSVRFQYHRAWLAEGSFRAAVGLDSIPGFLYEVAGPVPRAYVVPRASFHETDVDALNRALEAEFDPRGEVALVGAREDGDPSPPESAPGREGDPWDGEARIVEDTGERVRVEVRVARPGWLVLTDSHYPGWTAAADGEEREIHLANYFFRAVEVRPDDDEVVFRYRSRPFERGRRVSLATLVLLLVSGVGFRLRGRRSARGGGASQTDRDRDAVEVAGGRSGPV